jgi:hypothetical protein
MHMLDTFTHSHIPNGWPCFEQQNTRSEETLWRSSKQWWLHITKSKSCLWWTKQGIKVRMFQTLQSALPLNTPSGWRTKSSPFKCPKLRGRLQVLHFWRLSDIMGTFKDYSLLISPRSSRTLLTFSSFNLDKYLGLDWGHLTPCCFHCPSQDWSQASII